MENNLVVKKRSGELEALDYEKINKVLVWATEGINGVSASDIAMASEIEFFNNISTEEIHEVLIKTAANMITEDTPNYQYVAAKLKNYLLRKKVFNTYDKFPRLKDLIKRNVDRGVYDPLLLEKYDEYDIEKIENYIKHNRDEELTYAGISQLMDKYLLVDRTTGEHFETPQFMYMLIPMTIFADIKDKRRRRKLIKTTYDYISTHVISLPTPILGGVRTPNRQYSSCFPAGQKVNVKDGFEEIQNIEVGDLVLTHANEYKKVLATANKNFTGNLVTINTYNTLNDSFTSTEEHKILGIRGDGCNCIRGVGSCLTKKGKSKYCFKLKNQYKKDCPELNNSINKEWIEAKDIKPNDFIKVNYNKTINDVESINISDYINLPKHYVINEKNKILKETTDDRKRSGEYNDRIRPINNTVKLNNDFYRLIGYFLAEGSSSIEHGYIQFTFNKNETTYHDDVINILFNIFGVKAKKYINNNDNSCKISVFSKVLPNFFENFIGKGFNGKYINEVMMLAPKEKQMNLLKGVISGDGCTTNQGIILSLKNQNLIEQLYHISLRLKLLPSIRVNYQDKDTYDISYGKANLDFIKFIDKNFNRLSEVKSNIYPNGFWLNDDYYTKVRSVKFEYTNDEIVYDIQVEDDETFTVNHMCVHNCTLIDIDDTLDSIDSGETAVSKYISKRAGIGLNSRIRAIGAKVKNGEVEHTGIIPFIKRFESTVKSCSQGGIRGGAATIYYPFWHYEVEDLLVLKNNAGNELNRARRLDHAFQFSRLFYKRFLANEDITLFSPDEVPDLYEAFGYDNDLFDELYEKYERSRKTRKRKINARDYMNLLVKERIETGRIYIMNIDNANDHSSFIDKINMSNLCVEINLHTSPLQHIDDGKLIQRFIAVPEDKLEEYQEYKAKYFGLYVKNSDDENYEFLYKEPKGIKMYHPLEVKHIATKDNDGIYRDTKGRLIFDEQVEVVYGDNPAEIALCVLSALNLGNINSLDELEDISYITLSILDYVIETQDYPINAAKKMLKRRSVGVGVTNFAYWLVKNGLSYTSEKALEEVDKLFEHIQYYLIKASVQLAKEQGQAEWFGRSKYSKGELPIDHYNKNVDNLVNRSYDLDWEGLRQDILTHGMRNTTLTAIMPCESSSVVSSSTNGIEPIRSLITNKKSKSGSPLPVVVPEINKYKNKYDLAYSFENKHLNNIVSIIQKWIDQGISTNHYYDMSKYEDNSLPTSVVVKDILEFYKFGGKQIYYANTKDNNKEGDSDDALPLSDEYIDGDDSCIGGACAV